jgi:hypothetical protein
MAGHDVPILDSPSSLFAYVALSCGECMCECTGVFRQFTSFNYLFAFVVCFCVY